MDKSDREDAELAKSFRSWGIRKPLARLFPVVLVLTAPLGGASLVALFFALGESAQLFFLCLFGALFYGYGCVAAWRRGHDWAAVLGAAGALGTAILLGLLVLEFAGAGGHHH